MQEGKIHNLLRFLNYFSAFWSMISGALLLFLFPWVALILNSQPSADSGLFRLTGTLLIFIGSGYLWASRNAVKTVWYMWMMGVILNGILFLVEIYTALFRTLAYFYAIHGLASGLFCWAFLFLLTTLHYSQKIETTV
jgi:hypothetical protein